MKHSDELSLRRLTENEAVFRAENEKIERELAELSETAIRDRHIEYGHIDEIKLKFYCECCDENCRQRVELTVSEYREIHTDRKRFVVLPDHEVAGLERIVSNNGSYCEVEKFLLPPEDPQTLHSSNVQNV